VRTLPRVRARGWWPNRRAFVVDVALAVGVVALELGGAVFAPSPTPLWLRLPAALGAGAGLLVRRRLPLLALAAALLDTAVQGDDPSAALPFAAYAVTRYDTRRWMRASALGVAFLVAARFWDSALLGNPVSAAANAAIVVLLPAALGAYVAARSQLVTALRDRAERAEAAQELLARKAVLEERARIAREMHDVVGHRVSLMVLQAGAVEMAAGDPHKVGQLAAQMQNAGRQALTELRQLLGLLRSDDRVDPIPFAPQPTLADVVTLVEESRRAGMDVTLEPAGVPRPVPETVERAAYRVVQEALTNAGRHAPGGSVRVKLTYRPTELCVLVVNRRATRVPNTVPGGHGLVGLRERTQALGGELRASPRPDGGFAVEAVLPT
jgi:signal transduction histidine kinase